VLLKNRSGVIAEACLESLKLALIGGVDPQLENAIFREGEACKEDSQEQESSNHAR